MPGRSSPRLRLLDLMALVGASALGMGGYAAIDDGLYGGQRYFFGLFRALAGPVSLVELATRAGAALVLLLVVFGGWTLVLPILAASGPRTARRRVMRSAGIEACVAATTGMVAFLGMVGLGLAWGWATTGRASLGPRFVAVDNWGAETIAFAGFGVVAAWASRVFARRWRKPEGWLDRLGRAIGALWVASALVMVLVKILV